MPSEEVLRVDPLQHLQDIVANMTDVNSQEISKIKVRHEWHEGSSPMQSLLSA